MSINHKALDYLTWMLRRVLEIMPLLALACLAALTYWLLQQKVTLPGRAPTPVEHKPDYTLIDFTVRSFDEQGRPRTQLAGKQLDFYPDDETSNIDKPVVRSRNLETGALSQTVAARGLANRDGSEVQFFQSVVVTREGYVIAAKDKQPAQTIPPLEVKSEFLHIWTNEERMRSHLPTVVTRGKSRISADQIEASNYDGNIKLTGKAHVTLASKTATP
jgi:lipopolysaccharide export system protein LptC